jgi:hypothetical protein
MRALGKALYYLSGAKTAVDLLKTVAEVQNKLNDGTITGAVTAAGTSAGALCGAAFSAAAGAAMAAGLLLILKELDPEGNLGGITKPIDDFIEKMSGWNPSRDDLGFGDLLDGASKLLPFKSGVDIFWV